MKGKPVTDYQRNSILAKFGDSWPIYRIAEHLGLDRKTVSKIIADQRKRFRVGVGKLPKVSAPRSAYRKCANGHGLVQHPCLACEMQQRKRIERLTGIPTTTHQGVLALPLADIGLSIEIVEALEDMHYVYVGDLRGVSAAELETTGRFGIKRFAELAAALNRVLGPHLKRG